MLDYADLQTLSECRPIYLQCHLLPFAAHLAKGALANAAEEVEVPEVDGAVKVDLLGGGMGVCYETSELGVDVFEIIIDNYCSPLACSTARPWLARAASNTNTATASD